MGRGTRRTIILERMISLSQKDLGRLGFLDEKERHVTKPGTIARRNGLANESYCIQVTVSTESDYIKFDCIIDGKSMSQSIPLVKVLTQLTNHHSYYFRCLEANKNCRRLYLYEGKFICREAVPNKHYLQGTLSRRKRSEYKSLKRINRLERNLADAGRKWFQRVKDGKPTRCMQKVEMVRKELKMLVER